jgi:plasmid stabilization system protein ParE
MLYLISEDANRDLDEITDYFLSVSVDAGDKFVASFDRKCLYLTKFPPDRLVIARILNASRDLKAIFLSD